MKQLIRGEDYELERRSDTRNDGTSSVLVAIAIRSSYFWEHPLLVFTIASQCLAHNQAQGIYLNSQQEGTSALQPLTVWMVINRHLRSDRDLLMCQDELIDAGYEEWARL